MTYSFTLRFLDLENPEAGKSLADYLVKLQSGVLEQVGDTQRQKQWL